MSLQSPLQVTHLLDPICLHILASALQLACLPTIYIYSTNNQHSNLDLPLKAFATHPRTHPSSFYPMNLSRISKTLYHAISISYNAVDLIKVILPVAPYRLLSAEVPRLELEIPLRERTHIEPLRWHNLLNVLIR